MASWSMNSGQTLSAASSQRSSKSGRSAWVTILSAMWLSCRHALRRVEPRACQVDYLDREPGLADRALAASRRDHRPAAPDDHAVQHDRQAAGNRRLDGAAHDVDQGAVGVRADAE